MEDKLSHINKKGEANMVDVGSKPDMNRTAFASGKIFLNETSIQLIRENNIKKGDVFSVARIAGIQAAKQTAFLIPLCHGLQLSKIDIDFEVLSNAIKVVAMVKCNGKTGVEMEALTAVNIALLTIYDMCKAVDKEMLISEIALIEKTKTL